MKILKKRGIIKKVIDRMKLKKAFEKYCFQNKVRKLQIGCGGNIIEGFFNTDINTQFGTYYVDATKPFPFTDNTFHFIFSEHNFEHLSYHDGKMLLQECYRILKPNGVLRLTMPCLEFLIDIYHNPQKQEYRNYMAWHFKIFDTEKLEDFGEDYSPALLLNNFMRRWGHKCVYDKKTIQKLLEHNGFGNVTFHNVSESEHPELQNIEHHQYTIPAEYNTMETICVEAVKLG